MMMNLNLTLVCPTTDHRVVASRVWLKIGMHSANRGSAGPTAHRFKGLRSVRTRNRQTKDKNAYRWRKPLKLCTKNKPSTPSQWWWFCSACSPPQEPSTEQFTVHSQGGLGSWPLCLATAFHFSSSSGIVSLFASHLDAGVGIYSD